MASLGPFLIQTAIGTAMQALLGPQDVNSPERFAADPRVQSVRGQARRAERRTLLQRDRRTVGRRDELRQAQAGARASAAARGVAGGASARAVEQGLGRGAATGQSFDEAETDLDLEEIDARRDEQLQRIANDRRENLLDATGRRQRASLGILDQLQGRGIF